MTTAEERRRVTNFSIESIIGPGQANRQQVKPLDQCHTQHEQRARRAPTSSAGRLGQPTAPKQRAAQAAAQAAGTRHAKPKCRPKNFACPVCPMAFSNNGQLRNHLRIHTGERPFRCNLEQCAKTFTRNEELTRHKLIHTGVRPHACAHCGKRFGRKDHLKKHARTHLAGAGPLTTSHAGQVSPPTSGPHGGPAAFSKPRTGPKRRPGASSTSVSEQTSLELTKLTTPPIATNASADVGGATASAPLVADPRRQLDTTLASLTSLTSGLPMPSPLSGNSLAARGLTRGLAGSEATRDLAPGQHELGHIANIQQLANDYWQRWYASLIGYHQYCHAAGMHHQQGLEQQQQHHHQQQQHHHQQQQQHHHHHHQLGQCSNSSQLEKIMRKI